MAHLLICLSANCLKIILSSIKGSRIGTLFIDFSLGWNFLWLFFNQLFLIKSTVIQELKYLKATKSRCKGK